MTSSSRRLAAAAAIAFSLGSLGCLRSYNTTPLSPAALNLEAPAQEGLDLRTKAYFNAAEIAEKFGTKLAEDRQVIPVQVLISNRGTDAFRVLRASFILEATPERVQLGAMTPEQMYQIGRHGYGKPVCGMIFGGVLGLPSLITTLNANNKLQADYQRKTFVDALLPPAGEASGVVFFDPEPFRLKRNGRYTLRVEMENLRTKVQVILEQPLGA